MANTGNETMPTPDIAEGSVCAIINNKPKNRAILIEPNRINTGHSCAFGKFGLKVSSSKPAGNARNAPNNRGGHPLKVYCVTA